MINIVFLNIKASILIKNQNNTLLNVFYTVVIKPKSISTNVIISHLINQESPLPCFLVTFFLHITKNNYHILVIIYIFAVELYDMKIVMDNTYYGNK